MSFAGLFALWIFAQGTPPGTVQDPRASALSVFGPLVLMVVIMYVIIFRPQQKKAKEHQALLSKLATGDEVVTTGGLLGKVTDVGESFITIEIADGVRVKVQKFQVGSLMPKGTVKSA